MWLCPRPDFIGHARFLRHVEGFRAYHELGSSAHWRQYIPSVPQRLFPSGTETLGNENLP